MKEEICCPEFNKDSWDDKLINWNNKNFIKGKVPTFLFMPIGYGKVISKLQKQIDEKGANIPDYLCLSDHTSKWNMDILLATSTPIEGANNVTLSGNYYSKVYEGPFKDTGKWMTDFDNILKEKNYKSSKLYMWYTTCPKCAKKYGKNYTVVIAKIE